MNAKNDFLIKGYCHFRSFFNDEKLEKITKSANNIICKSKKNKWKHIKVYREYPTLFNNINLFGVEYPLNIKLNETTFDEFQQLNYKELLLNLLEWKNFNTTLIRLHSNSSFYNYQGEWHRDDNKYPSPNSVQAIIYLLDEEGYRIVPKSKNSSLKEFGISTNTQRDPSKAFADLPKDMFDIIKAKKGDILIHESGLLHQGFCKKKRIHFHLRHIRSDNIQNKSKDDIFNFSECYKKNFNIDSISSNANFRKTELKNKLTRLKTFVLYFFPRFKSTINNILNSKNKQSIFHSTFWQ
jgi:hypothetical protein